MKRASLRLGLAAGLGWLTACATPTPREPTPNVESSSPVKQTAPIERDVAWLQLEAEAELTRRGPDGRVAFSHEEKETVAVGYGNKNSTLLVVGREQPALVRLDGRGKEDWRVKLPGDSYFLGQVDETVFAVGYRTKTVHLFDAASGRARGEVHLEREVIAADGYSNVLVTVDDQGITRWDGAGKALWSKPIRSYPTPTTVGFEPSHKHQVAVANDGTVVVAGADQSVLAFSEDGAALYQFGLRFPLESLFADNSGGVLFNASARGVGLGFDEPGKAPKLVGPRTANPRVRSLRSRWDLKTSRDSTVAAVPIVSSSDYDAQAVSLDGKPVSPVALLVREADDVWLLAYGEKAGMAVHVWHFDGKEWKDEGSPAPKLKKEVFAKGRKAEVGSFEPQELAVGVDGKLLVLGFRVGETSRVPLVVERTGNGFVERREWKDVFSQAVTDDSKRLSYAVSSSGQEVVCAGQLESCWTLAPRTSAQPFDIKTATQLGVKYEPINQREWGSTPIFFAGDALIASRGVSVAQDDNWVLGGGAIIHAHGSDRTRIVTPYRSSMSILPRSESDIWITDAGGLAHYDGTKWTRSEETLGQVGAPSYEDWRVAGAIGASEVWAYGPRGLFRVKKRSGPSLDVDGVSMPDPPPTTSALQAVGELDPSFKLEPVTVQLGSDRPLRTALDVAQGQNGVLWLHEGSRVVEVDGANTRVLVDKSKLEPFSCVSAPQPDCMVCVSCSGDQAIASSCPNCLAPRSAGTGAFVDDYLRVVAAGTQAPGRYEAYRPGAVSVDESGAVWTIMNGDAPRILVTTASSWSFLRGLAPAGYLDIAARGQDDVWVAGGLAFFIDDDWVVGGEGTLAHFDGHSFRYFRGPEGALTAVTSAGPNEAWAVGARGGIVHVQGDQAVATRLSTDSTLRAASARGASDVWIGGEDRTLLHWDGKSLRPIDTSAATQRSSFLAIVPPTDQQPGWVVGPTGIWRITRSASSMK
ncbi:MAG: hypothetical protein U0271_38260 [Polyangiaceae bacterium]